MRQGSFILLVNLYQGCVYIKQPHLPLYTLQNSEHPPKTPNHDKHRINSIIMFLRSKFESMQHHYYFSKNCPPSPIGKIPPTQHQYPALPQA